MIGIVKLNGFGIGWRSFEVELGALGIIELGWQHLGAALYCGLSVGCYGGDLWIDWWFCVRSEFVFVVSFSTVV